jgi:hypothetical protein
MLGRLTDVLHHTPAQAGAQDNPKNVLLGDALKLNCLLGVPMDSDPKYRRITQRNVQAVLFTHPQTARATMQADMRPSGTGNRTATLPAGGLLGNMRG